MTDNTDNTDNIDTSKVKVDILLAGQRTALYAAEEISEVNNLLSAILSFSEDEIELMRRYQQDGYKVKRILKEHFADILPDPLS